MSYATNPMTPAVLVSLPNAPYLLGTFDTTGFMKWWRSQPFCDSIETIIKGFQIYGRSHLAIARRTDGRWVVYRSLQYGIDWDQRSFVAAEGEVIYDIVMITYGHAIMNTSLGFYETTKAGYPGTWTKIADLPPSAKPKCSMVNIGGDGVNTDILLCTDGRYIWRSVDKARTWTLVCDMQTLDFKYKVGTAYYTGPSEPAIAGANGYVMAAAGPFLVTSVNAGLSFQPKIHWMWYNSNYKTFYPPKNIVYDRLWEPGALTNPRFVIKQILISSIDGPEGGDVCFIVKADDRLPLSGESVLYSRVYKTYSANYADYGYQKNYFLKYLDAQALSPSEGQQMDAYDVPVTGQNYNDKLVFSAQTKIAPDGSSFVSLKYSRNGGHDWTSIDISDIKVYDTAEMGDVPVLGGSFLDDSYSKNTWTHPACCNAGKWRYTEGTRDQCQSYEVAANISHATVAKQQPVDSIVESEISKDESVDAIVEEVPQAPYDVDSLLDGVASKLYRIDGVAEAHLALAQPVDLNLSKDNQEPESVDAHIWARPYRAYLVAPILLGRPGRPYLVDVRIYPDSLIEKLADIDWESPQFLDLELPESNKAPMNSRKDVL